MELNLAKTNVIVFRNCAKLSSKEKFLYNGKIIDIVTHYKYLGIVITIMFILRALDSFEARTLPLSARAKQGPI